MNSLFGYAFDPFVCTCVKETMVLVTEVPMLAPIIIGIAFLKFSYYDIYKAFDNIHFNLR